MRAFDVFMLLVHFTLMTYVFYVHWQLFHQIEGIWTEIDIARYGIELLCQEVGCQYE